MAGIQRDILINYQADPTALIAASQKAQAAVNQTADASVAASDKATKAAQEAAKAQAKAAEKAASKAEEAYEDMADAAVDANHRAAESADRAADGFGKVGESAGKLGGVLEMLGIEGASTIGDLADAGEVAAQSFGAVSASVGGAAAVLGAVVGVVGVIGAAFAVLAETAHATGSEVEFAAETLEVFKNNAEAVAAAQIGTNKAFANAEIQVGLATGAIEDYEAAAFAAAQGVRDGAATEIKAREDAIAAIQAEQQAIQDKLDANDYESSTLDDLYIKQNRLNAQYSEATSALDDLTESTNKHANAVLSTLLDTGKARKDEQEAEERARKAAEYARKEEEKRAEALRKTTDALRESAAAMQESSATTAQYAAGIAQIQAVSEDYQASLLTGADAIEAARKREQAGLLAIYQQTVALAQTNEELATANKEYAASRAAIDEKYAAQQKTVADEQATKLAENHALALQYQREETATLGEAFTARAAFAQAFFDSYLGTYANAIGQVAQLAADFSQQALDESTARLDQLASKRDDLTEQQKENAKAAQEATDAQTRSELEAANAILAAKKDALKEQAKEERQQAMKAFRINQAIQIAQSVAGAALAVLNAFATVPYPASIVAAAAAAATGAATIATVAAQKPQFHQGGVIQASVLPGEGIANRDLVRTVGESTFNAMNRNPEAAAQAINGGTTLVIGRQVVGEIGRNLMVGRSPVSQAINGRARPGQVALGTSNLSVVS